LQTTINAKVAEYEQLKEAQAEAEKQRQREERKRRREERKREQEEFDQAFKELEDEFEDELELEEDFFEAQGDLIMSGFKREQELAAAKQAALDAEVASTLAALDEISTAEQEAYNEKEQLIKEERQLISDTNDMRVKMAVQSFQAIEALGKAFASKDEKDAEKSFKVQKALNLASATMSATESVIQAFKTAQTSPLTILNPAYPFIQAGIAAAFGIAQVATIKRTQFESPAQPNAGGYGGGGASASAPSAAPQLDLGFLGAGGGQTGFRSYVIASEVSNSQQANQRINDQASLIG
jgi:actin-related protein